jgi:neopullulanase
MKKFKILLINYLILLAFCCLPWMASFSQNQPTIEPPNWWTGMKNPELQLMVYAKDIGLTRATIGYPGVELRESIAVANPDYLFLNLYIAADVKPGTFEIRFMMDKKQKYSYTYSLEQRKAGSSERIGFNSADVIYLLMPDRFANGDPSNDNMPGMKEKADRSNSDGRHGGDLKGIADHLDYFADLGVSTIWLNPVLENNMPAYSYHGYAITDFYRVDPRFGSNDDFRQLVSMANDKGLKIVKDMVFNHFGTEHLWMKSLPMPDWINQWPTFTRSNYRAGTIMDPYASEADKNRMLKGWFDTTMADLNQENHFVANYLIQNSIWWIEYAGLSGIRMDTYPYSDKEFMKRWVKEVNDEYPDFSVLGEAWLNVVPQVAYWQDNNHNPDGFRSNLPFVFNFPLKYAITDAFNEDNGWSTGVSKLYETLSLDYLYSDPLKTVTFADNHDADRIFTRLGKDMDKFKMAMAFVFTVRGIPSIYYGTEILMTGWEHDGHGYIREDFPGGWPNDAVDVFNRKGLTPQQNEAFGYLQRLMKWRADKAVIHTGNTRHYVPEDGIYVFFRYNGSESVMVVFNNNKSAKKLRLDRFAEDLDGYPGGRDVMQRTQINELKVLELAPMSVRIIELTKP